MEPGIANGMLNGLNDKQDRIEQLRRLGFNVPRIIKIPAGTVLDSQWRRAMERVRAGDARMTVRSYHPVDEIRFPRGPFFPERPAEEAYRLASEMVRDWNVLWQEAVSADETRLCGDVLVLPDGSGSIEAARGPGFRVRDIHLEGKVPDTFRVSLSFSAAENQFDEADIEQLVRMARAAANRLRIRDGIVLEFNIQEHPVGVRREQLLFWEWRPVAVDTSYQSDLQFPPIDSDSRIWSFGCQEGRSAFEPSHAAVGNKGFNLIKLTREGFSVPPGFIIPAATAAQIAESPQSLEHLWREIIERFLKLHDLGEPTARPSLWSIRSSPAISLPGLLKTVINVGLTEDTLGQFDESIARELLQEYVYSLATAQSPLSLIELRRIIETSLDSESSPVAAYREMRRRFVSHGVAVPETVEEQLRIAIRAVIESAWQTFRVRAMAGGAATAVIVQRMVLGNIDDQSGSGVIFTRDPTTGYPELFIEFLRRAQGPELVSGRRDPQALADLLSASPSAPGELTAAARAIERSFGDMQEIEFTVESGKLWILQARKGTRTKVAALTIAHGLMAEGTISKEAAASLVRNITSSDILVRSIASSDGAIAQGVGGSPGAAVGGLLTEGPASGEPGVWAVEHFEDAFDMVERAAGVIAARGGATSHGVVLARSLGVPVVLRVTGMTIQANGIRFGDTLIRYGDVISIDGSTGLIFAGTQPIHLKPVVSLSGDVLAWFSAVSRSRNGA